MRSQPIQPAESQIPQLPEVDGASVELSRRQARAISLLLIRIVLLSILIAAVSRQSPIMRQYTGALDALAGVFALWPFFTATGRIYAQRIALGRAFAAHDRWNEVIQMLNGSAGGLRPRLFDATGEGRYLLARAWTEMGRVDLARPLLAQIAVELNDRTEFGRLAAQAGAGGSLIDVPMIRPESKATS